MEKNESKLDPLNLKPELAENIDHNDDQVQEEEKKEEKENPGIGNGKTSQIKISSNKELKIGAQIIFDLILYTGSFWTRFEILDPLLNSQEIQMLKMRSKYLLVLLITIWMYGFSINYEKVFTW